MRACLSLPLGGDVFPARPVALRLACRGLPASFHLTQTWRGDLCRLLGADVLCWPSRADFCSLGLRVRIRCSSVSSVAEPGWVTTPLPTLRQGCIRGLSGWAPGLYSLMSCDWRLTAVTRILSSRTVRGVLCEKVKTRHAGGW